MIRDEEAAIKEFREQAKKQDWDELAYGITVMERAILLEKDDNYLILLKIRLKIWEEEKNSRVFDSFDMEYFLSKDFNEFDEDF
jgi:hypothetical protein